MHIYAQNCIFVVIKNMGMKGILFQKHKALDEYGITTDVYGSDDFGVVPLSHAFNVELEQKDLPSNDWLDENGDDDFVPDAPVFKAFEDTIEFGLEAESPQDAISSIGIFITYLSYGGVFSMYDERTTIGYSEVRFVKLEPMADKIEKDGKSIIQFKIVFKINSPTNYIRLEKTASANVENIQL